MNARAKEIDFIASVTHDLKSPLNGILCMIELMKMEILSGNPNPATMLDNLEIADKAGRDMLELVNNMLTTSRMQAGKEVVNPYILGRSELIERAMGLEKTFHSEAKSKNVDFSVTILNLPNAVYWDINKIRFFAINNLISNALKFASHKGGTVKVVVDSDDSNNVIISVMDDGPGIPVNERDGVFGKFVQASNNSRNFQGGGFGLFNASQIIAMHHGSIEILDGLNGRGVTFRAKIPAIPFEIENPALRKLVENGSKS
jgi:signal transduction histidine kinase